MSNENKSDAVLKAIRRAERNSQIQRADVHSIRTAYLTVRDDYERRLALAKCAFCKGVESAQDDANLNCARRTAELEEQLHGTNCDLADAKSEIDRLTALVPKEVVMGLDNGLEQGVTAYSCPICGNTLINDGHWIDVACSSCGAKLIWPEESK